MGESVNVEQGYFSVIRWCPSVAREEYHNIGIVLVDEEGHVAQVRYVPPSAMPASIAKPGIVTNWLSALQTRFQGERVGRHGLERLSEGLYRSIQVTPPRPTAVLGGDWSAAFERLWTAYARPTPRPAAGNLRAVFERRWRELIRNNVIAQDYAFEATASGQPRSVQFFANSGANVALDTLDLALKRASAIQDRADAEAMKILDIRQKNGAVRFVTYCVFPAEPALDEARQGAIRVLNHYGAGVVTDAEEAARSLERAARLPSLLSEL